MAGAFDGPARLDMLLLRKPSDCIVSRFLASQRSAPFSYDEIGATGRAAPAGFVLDHNRVQLGHGAATYERAIASVRRCEMFNLGWVTLAPSGAPIAPGVVVAVAARVGPIYWLNACRIVYAFDDRAPVRRFGFAYGTLPDHAERGEERFTVEWLDDGSVWYDILAFSQPRHPLARLGKPLARVLQRRFARDSLAVMRRSVA
jgi:uncharacterized protein (UPF0548 family)